MRLRTALTFVGLFPIGAAAQRGGILRGRVLADSLEVPIASAGVSLPDLQRVATTDSLGRFRLAGIPRSSQTVLVRRPGFAPYSTRLRFKENDSLEVDFILAPVVQTLPGVDVVTPLNERRLAEFNERRRFGIGHFLDSAAIANGPGSRLSEKIRHLPGLLVACNGYNCNLLSTRAQQTALSSSRCPVGMGLNGVVVNRFNINDYQPSEVLGIEFYSGPSQMPARFNATRNTCGLLMVWTK